jgi:DUF1009 family protein
VIVTRSVIRNTIEIIVTMVKVIDVNETIVMIEGKIVMIEMIENTTHGIVIVDDIPNSNSTDELIKRLYILRH